MQHPNAVRVWRDEYVSAVSGYLIQRNVQMRLDGYVKIVLGCARSLTLCESMYVCMYVGRVVPIRIFIVAFIKVRDCVSHGLSLDSHQLIN